LSDDADDEAEDSLDYDPLPGSFATRDDRAPFVPPSQRVDAPLAGILNPHLNAVDPR
jgi:hypothetical protein